tara:strand:- start:499 stop:1110 length:612 start_codon:yes stop_codon:yes gene_type:complete
MKKILSDCDGVLLDWAYSFDKWMKFHFDLEVTDYSKYDVGERYQSNWDLLDRKSGENMFYLPRVFCNSSRIGSLKPLRDSVKYVKKLYEEHGITIDVITSLSLDPETQKLRRHNLRKVFGDAIDRIVFLDTGADKDDMLEEWRDSELLWVEDKFENAQLGIEMGLQSILIEHEYNRDQGKKARDAGIRVVSSWREIYNIAVGE